MSRALISRIFILAAFGLLAGALGAHLLLPEEMPERSPASSSRPQGFGKNRLLHGKSLAVIQVALQAPEGIPSDERQETTLVGWVRLNQDAEEETLNFRWEIPDGVQVLEGETSGFWEGARKGETFEVRLKVRGFSSEVLRMIALHGSLHAGPTQFGNSALLTSRPEDSYEIVTGETSAAETPGSQKVRAASAPGGDRPLLRGRILR